MALFNIKEAIIVVTAMLLSINAALKGAVLDSINIFATSEETIAGRETIWCLAGHLLYKPTFKLSDMNIQGIEYIIVIGMLISAFIGFKLIQTTTKRFEFNLKNSLILFIIVSTFGYFLVTSPSLDIFNIDIPYPNIIGASVMILITFVIIKAIEIPTRFDFALSHSVILFIIIFFIIKLIGFYLINNSVEGCALWADETSEMVEWVYMTMGLGSLGWIAFKLHSIKR